MAAPAARLDHQRRAARAAGGPNVRAAIEAFLDSPRGNRSPNTRQVVVVGLDQVPVDHVAAGVAE